jgi:bifunctional N-acetylglucosamine-1-phosphate-uridyltransferase/glucosamine-1-phosphate-acetyltransferase GlmU-like protein
VERRDYQDSNRNHMRTGYMLIHHLNNTPQIHPSAYVAPTATVCGNVKVGRGCRIMFGSCIAAEGRKVEIGDYCIVMENAVIRSTDRNATKIGSYCLVGPQAHLVGCTLEAPSSLLPEPPSFTERGWAMAQKFESMVWCTCALSCLRIQSCP